MITNGIHFEGDTIKFIGFNTDRTICYKASGNSYKEIFEQLVDMEVITSYDESPEIKYMLDKLGKSYDDYEVDEEIDFDQLRADGEKFMTDEAYREIISAEDGNAYYQEWN